MEAQARMMVTMESPQVTKEVESMVAEYVKKIFKYVKKVNMYGYNVHLREGRHHQRIKFTKIEHKPKKKVVKERRPRQKETIAIREWTSGGESSSSRSSDESRKNFTTRFMYGPSSSPHMCLMAQGLKLKNSMLSMILVQPLLQIMNICFANSNCLARSVMS
jgi:hypothetical protein